MIEEVEGEEKKKKKWCEQITEMEKGTGGKRFI